MMTRLNVEIKAKCDYPDIVRRILKSEAADFRGTDHQIDTYFQVPSGRLKLRQGRIENALIYYVRDNTPGPKESRVNLYLVTDGSSLKALLTQALGVLAVVDKKREIYFLDGVKFHLDQVNGLGSFFEIEAMNFETCKFYLNLFGISEKDYIPVSYSDLILERFIPVP